MKLKKSDAEKAQYLMSISRNLSHMCAIFQRPDLWEIIWRVGWVRPRLGRKQPASQCRFQPKSTELVLTRGAFGPRLASKKAGELVTIQISAVLASCWFRIIWIHLWLWHVKTSAFHDAVQGDAQDEPEELVTSSANSCSTAWTKYCCTVFWAISQEELSPTDQASSLGLYKLSKSKGPNCFAKKTGRTSFAVSCHGQRLCHWHQRCLFQETESRTAQRTEYKEQNK